MHGPDSVASNRTLEDRGAGRLRDLELDRDVTRRRPRSAGRRGRTGRSRRRATRAGRPPAAGGNGEDRRWSRRERSAAEPAAPASSRLALIAILLSFIMESDRWLGLDLRHLLALTAIAEEGSFGRAAERLGYTQSAISQQIATLERIVGLRLVERPGGPRPISLTEAGRDPRPARGGDRGPAPGGEGGHARARGGRRRPATGRDVPERRHPHPPDPPAPLLRGASGGRGGPPRVGGRGRAARDDRAGRARPDLLDAAGEPRSRTSPSSCCATPTCSSSRQGHRSPS